MAFRNTKTPTMNELREGKQKYTVPKRRSKAGPMEFYLPDEMVEQFKKDLTNEMNRTVMEWYGISFSTLQRFKRELGVVKDMAKVRHKQAMLTKRICEKNGYYDSLRGNSPSEATIEGIKRKWREDGKHPLQRIKEKNPVRYKRIMKKRSQHRKELFATERRRYELTLMPLTNIPTHLYSCHYTKSQTCKRNSAKKRGYILGSIDPDLGERMMLYYTDKTQRAEIFERNCVKEGFEIRSLSSRGKILSTEENLNPLLPE